MKLKIEPQAEHAQSERLAKNVASIVAGHKQVTELIDRAEQQLDAVFSAHQALGLVKPDPQ